jgi:hypothetical protein
LRFGERQGALVRDNGTGQSQSHKRGHADRGTGMSRHGFIWSARAGATPRRRFFEARAYVTVHEPHQLGLGSRRVGEPTASDRTPLRSRRARIGNGSYQRSAGIGCRVRSKGAGAPCVDTSGIDRSGTGSRLGWPVSRGQEPIAGGHQLSLEGQGNRLQHSALDGTAAQLKVMFRPELGSRSSPPFRASPSRAAAGCCSQPGSNQRRRHRQTQARRCQRGMPATSKKRRADEPLTDLLGRFGLGTP